MKNLVHCFISAIISPEIVVIGVCILLWRHVPGVFLWGDRVIRDSSSIYWIAPQGVLVMQAIRMTYGILFPPVEHEDLITWKLYPRLRCTCLCGDAFVLIGAVTSFMGVVACTALGDGVPSLMVLSGYSVGSVSVATMFVASLRVRSMLIGGQ